MTRALTRLLLATGQGAHTPDVFFSSRLALSKSSQSNPRAKATSNLFFSAPSLTWASSSLTPAKLSTGHVLSLVTCPYTPSTSLRCGELAATLGLLSQKSTVYLRHP